MEGGNDIEKCLCCLTVLTSRSNIGGYRFSMPNCAPEFKTQVVSESLRIHISSESDFAFGSEAPNNLLEFLEGNLASRCSTKERERERERG